MATPLIDPSSSFLTKTKSRIRMMPRSTRSTRSGRPLPSHANAGELDNQVVESGHNGPERRDRILGIAEAALLSLVTLAAA